MKTVDFCFGDNNFTVLRFFSFFKSGDEFGFGFDCVSIIVVLHRQHWEAGAWSFGVWDCGPFFSVRSKNLGLVKGRRGLSHNFIANVSSEAGNEQMESDVVITILDAKVNEVQGDLGKDVNAESGDFGQGPHDGAEGVLLDPLLIEFFEGGHFVDRISHSDIVVDDAFVLALDEGRDVDRGGSRGADGQEGVQQGSFEGVPVVNVDIRCKVDAAGVGEGRTSQSVDDIGHGAGVGPS
jgi:hypothetical protein